MTIIDGWRQGKSLKRATRLMHVLMVGVMTQSGNAQQPASVSQFQTPVTRHIVFTGD
jgi:hypothetical protein